MHSTDLTEAQAKQIRDCLSPTLDYLSRLQKRMEHEHWDPTDKLFVDVCKAQAAMQDLCMSLHYVTCDGVGREVSISTRQKA